MGGNFGLSLHTRSTSLLNDGNTYYDQGHAAEHNGRDFFT